ncbi:MAG: hypothetical protein K2N65_04055, partial [Anaeroplasmataceae bacterium]|nr:hypothetical protein [Anaeroplasmataceae bacterium]
QYYATYEQFDDAVFCTMLNEEQKKVYLENLDKVRGSNDPYTDSDLECIFQKMHSMHFKAINKDLSNVILNSTDT